MKIFTNCSRKASIRSIGVFSPILSRFRVPEEEHAYRMEFYAKGLSAVVMRWVISDCKDPAEKIAEIIKACAFMPPRGAENSKQ